MSLIIREKQLAAIQFYKDTIDELTRDSQSALDYLKFSSRVHKYSFQDQVQLFANNPEVDLIANFDQWKALKRPVSKGQKSIRLWDYEHNRLKHVFDVSQTVGNDVRIFDWNITETDKLNLSKYLVQNNPIFDAVTSFENQMDLLLYDKVDHAQFDNSIVTKILTCSKYVVSKRMGLPIHGAFENDVLKVLEEFQENAEFVSVIEASQEISKKTLLEVEHILRKEFHKEMTYYEYAKNQRELPATPRNGGVSDKPNRAIVSEGRDIAQPTTRTRANENQTTESDGQSHLDISIGNEQGTGSAMEVRGNSVLSNQGAGSKIREPMDGIRGAIDETNTRANGVGEKGAVFHGDSQSSVPNGTIGDNRFYDRRSVVDGEDNQIDKKQESVTENVADFFNSENAKIRLKPKSKNLKKENRQQMSLFAPIDATEDTNESKDEDVEVESALEQTVIETTQEHNLSNWSFPEGDFYDTRTRDKLYNNYKAIQLVKMLENENRVATKEEQEILAKYVGWGGLQNTFDETKDGVWKEQYIGFKKLLTDEEWESARRSIDTAYYTDPRLAKAIFEGALQLGLKPKNILDPGTGTGNFLSVLPDDANLYGVEIEPLTASITKHLYPNAKIANKGFEEMPFDDNSFDLVIGNIPFGEIKIVDKARYKKDFNIHDYFTAKSIDVVRPDGIVAFVTSTGTLDKKDSTMRRYIAERADLVGAIRLPNNAFKDIAGTAVTSDVLFFKKLPEMRDLDIETPEWVHTMPFFDRGAVVNKYFENNPSHILGNLQLSGQFGGTTTEVKPWSDHNLYDGIRNTISEFLSLDSSPIDELDIEIENQVETNNELDLDAYFNVNEDGQIQPPRGVRNNTYFVVDNKLYFNRLGFAEAVDTNPKSEQRLKDMCAIRHSLVDVINIQTQENYSQHDYEHARSELNVHYDYFVKKHGHFRDDVNKRAFRSDDQLPLLLSVEKVNKDKSISKADIFFEPTIRPKVEIRDVDNAHDALLVSMARKLTVDLDYMEEISLFSKDELIHDLVEQGMIFQEPSPADTELSDMEWVYRDEYLSGDVKEKLKTAQKFNAEGAKWQRNVDALENAQPDPVPVSDIKFQLGSTWIPTRYYQDFMYETFETPRYNRSSGDGKLTTVEHSWWTNGWSVTNKNLSGNENYLTTSKYGTKRMSAYHILEKTLELGQVNIYDKVMDKPVLNVKETMLAREKQEQLKQRFQNWLFDDPARANELVDLYNDQFNIFAPREYDGSHLEFTNLNASWTLRPHQANAVARTLYSRTGLYAHEVGAGKTATMVAAGMYMKQIGVVNKPLFVVPTHLTEQFASEFMSMYPTANVLMTTKRDFQKKSRQEFISKIATNDYDAVILGQTQFEKIPLSLERQKEYIENQIVELREAKSRAAAEDKKSFSLKEMLKFEKALEGRLKKLSGEHKKDDVIDFEQLGIDFMFIDEAHAYKNLANPTKLSNVAGVNTSKSQRAFDMLMKCRYIQEQNNGTGVVFATGTPISNSMSELYTMQNFLQPAELRRTINHHFDAWASNFGNVTHEIEPNPEGSGYKMRSRFKNFQNMPELMNMFRMVADIQTHEMLNLPTPELRGGKATIVVSEPSDYQEGLMLDLAERAEAVRNGRVDPQDDNMLKITNEAKLMAIDPRLIDEDAPISEDSKIFQCVDNVHRIWQETADNKSTQIIFSDSGIPKSDKFNVYDEIKHRLILKGVPEHEIAFIHDAKTDAQREKLFEQVRSGDIRVILGSTNKLGTGVNIQNKLIAGHHVDCPWRPSDIIQRDGRVIRQGNENEEVQMYRYVTKGTFDAYLWKIQEDKQRYISQVMSGRSISRTCDDLDETVLTAAEVKAIATSNPLLLEKMNTDNEMARLQMLKNNWTSERLMQQNRINKEYPIVITGYEKELTKRQHEIDISNVNPLPKDKDGKDIYTIELDGRVYDKRTEAFEVIRKMMSSERALNGEVVELGTFRGLKLTGHVNRRMNDADIKINGRYPIAFDALTTAGILMRINNKINDFPKELESKEHELETVRSNLKMTEIEVDKPFEHEERLSKMLSKQLEINMKIELGVVGDVSEDQESEELVEVEETVKDSNVLDDFTPPAGFILIESERDGMIRQERATWERMSPTQREAYIEEYHRSQPVDDQWKPVDDHVSDWVSTKKMDQNIKRQTQQGLEL